MKRRLASFFITFALSPSLGFSQNPPKSPTETALEAASVDDLSVVYEAAYFDQFQPVSVNDMVSRIPGIGLALGGGGGKGDVATAGGKNPEALDDALVEFSIAYSKQNEVDYHTFLKATPS